MSIEQQIEHISKQLASFFPKNTEEIIANWIVNNNVRFKVSKPRQTKLGDFRPAMRKEEHRISINSNLNQYSFLITSVHEFAHLHTWEEFGAKVSPHGKEWKLNFQKLLIPIIKKNVFPQDITKALITHMNNPAASSCSDHNLLKILQQYDENSLPYLDDIAPNSKFMIGNKVFIKGEKRRTRYKCMDITSERFYLVNSMAQVHIIES